MSYVVKDNMSMFDKDKPRQSYPVYLLMGEPYDKNSHSRSFHNHTPAKAKGRKTVDNKYTGSTLANSLSMKKESKHRKRIDSDSDPELERD